MHLSKLISFFFSCGGCSVIGLILIVVGFYLTI